MKILVASSVSPRRHGNGAELQVAHLIANLRPHHDVHTVYAGPEGDPDIGPATRVAPCDVSRMARERDRVLGVVTPVPFLVRRLERAGFGRAVRESATQTQPDVVLVTNGPASYVCEHLTGIPRVLSTIDSWSLNERAIAQGESGLARLYKELPLRRVTAYDRRILPAFDAITTVADQDRRWMLSLSPGSDIEVISNGVDTDYFSPTHIQESLEGTRSLVFHGVMDYPPNVLAAQFLVSQVLPIVRAAHPDVRVMLVGRSPASRLSELASDTVTITGGVDDLRPYLAQATVTIYPLLSGTGAKNKVLEAAAMARPIVATPSAIGDLELHHDQQCLIAPDARGLAAHVIDLLEQPRPELGRAAREVVRERHSWERAGAATAAVCERVAAWRAQSHGSDWTVE